MNKKLILKISGIFLGVLILISAVVYKQSIDNLQKLENEIESRMHGIELIWDTDNRAIDLTVLWYYSKFLDRDEVVNYKFINSANEILFSNGVNSSKYTHSNKIDLKNKGEFVVTLFYEINLYSIFVKTVFENLFYILLIGILTFSIAIVVYLIEYFEHEKTRLLLEQSHKLAAIGQTAAMLAHDVRKPFASVKALLANLNFFVKNPDKLDVAQKDLNKTISNVENMIADIMDFSREQKYELSRIDIKPIIENSILEIKQNINEKFQINFKTELNHKNFPLIDEHKIKRVFQNILGNAVEAITIMGNKTSGNVEIKTEEVRHKFIIRISNDGPKLSKEASENIFESFFTSGKNSGTGLGLASVKKIIELHGGTIIAQNIENDEGVEFVISFPMEID